MRIKTVDYTYVTIQVLLFIAYTFTGKIGVLKLPFWIEIIGLGVGVFGFLIIVIAVIQLKTNLSPFPSPKKNSTLINKGLYYYVRHPIYTGILLVTFGFACYTASVYKLLVALVLGILLYYKSQYEEKLLHDQFSEYKNYIEQTGRFFPRIK